MNSVLPSAHHKFEALDGLRGVAAIVVIIFHFNDLFGKHIWFAHGYLAVDLFFILSGFVISFAYQKRLDEGLSTLAFLKLRIVRLYPLYIVGLLLGVLYTVRVEPFQHLPHIHGAYFLILLPALFFIPIASLPSATPRFAFPYNFPAWSLFFELFANVVHAAFLRRRSTQALLGCFAICCPVVAWSVVRRGALSFGSIGNETLEGIPRVMLAYIAGMLLYRFWAARRGQWNIPSLVSFVLMVAVFSLPQLGRLNGIFDLLCDLAILPLIVAMAAFSNPRGRAIPVYTFLGITSYAIYVLHAPVGSFVRYLSREPSPAVHAFTPAMGFAMLLALVLLATLLDTCYDIPVRRWLRSGLRH